MTEPTLSDVYERLGGLRSDVGGLREDMAEAREDRQKLAADVSELTLRTAKLEQIVEKLEPTVNSLTDIRKKAIGGIAVLVFLLGFVGWIVGLFMAELKTWLIRVIAGH